MRDFKFDLEETKDYYLQSLRKYHVGIPNWNLEQIITREDVDTYVKDAENILQC